MKLKRILSTFVSIALVFTSASCRKETEDKKVHHVMSERIDSYFLASELEIKGRPQNSFLSSLLCATDGKLFVISEYSEKSPEDLFLSVNTKTGEKTEVSKSLDDFPECRNVKMHDGKIYFCCTKNNKIDLAVMDRNTGEITAEKTFDIGINIPSLNVNSEGDLFFAEVHDGNIITVCTCDKDTLEYKERCELSLKENSAIKKGAYPESMYLNDDGSYCFVWLKQDENFYDTSKWVSCYSAENELLYETEEISDLSGMYAGSGISKNGNLFVASHSLTGRGYFADEIDITNGEICGRYNIKALADNIISGVRADDCDVVFAFSEGIYGYTFETEKLEKKYGYSELSENMTKCGYGSYENDEILFLTVTDNLKNENSGRQIIAEFDENGNHTANHIPVLQFDEGVISHAVSVSGGMLYYIEYGEGEDVYIHSFDTKTDTDKNFRLPQKINDEIEWSNISSISADDNGNILLDLSYISVDASARYYCLTDMSGKIKKIKTDDEIISDSDIKSTGGIIFGKNGSAYISGYDRNYRYFIAKFDTETFGIGDRIETEYDVAGNFVSYTGDEYDFCCADGDGIYGYSAKDNSMVEIVDLYNSNMADNSGFYSFSVIDEERAVINARIITGNICGDEMLVFLKKADDATLEKINSRQIINAACLNINENQKIKQKINEFNRNSEDYRIQVINYGKYHISSDSGNSQSGVSMLTEDVISGNIPDVIIGNYELDTFTYVRNGFYTDLNKFIENDNEVKREDFIENIFDAYTFDGKLCQVIPNVFFRTVAGKSSKLGNETGWTFDEFFDEDSREDVFYGEDRDYAVRFLITENLSEFVDFEKFSCDFESDRFVKLIELLKKETMPSDEYEIEYAKTFENADESGIRRKFVDGRCTAELNDIYFHKLLIMEQKASICEDTVIKGVPSADKTVGLICPAITLGIAEKSKVKDGAWSFVREFLLDENIKSESVYINDFPVRKATLENLTKMLYEKRLSQIETAEGELIEIPDIDPDSQKKIEYLAENSSRLAVTDTSVKKIIDEQLDIYFNGGQSSADTAKNIQNKVSRYLSEIK